MTIHSKSGKVQYLCGKCRSPDVLGPIVIYGQQSIVCGPCAAWMSWTSRLKVSVKTFKTSCIVCGGKKRWHGKDCPACVNATPMPSETVTEKL